MLVRTARIDGDDDGMDAQLFPAHTVMVLDVIGAIAEQSVNGQVSCGLGHGRDEVGTILTGSGADLQRGDQMSRMMGYERHLGITPVLLHPACPSQKVATDVMTFQARRVDGGLGAFVDQAATLGEPEKDGQQSLEGPFFRSRSCAF